MHSLTPPAHTELQPATATRPNGPVAATPPTTTPASRPAKPTPRVRYWEQMDPTSRSLYPVD